jgi:hypothetical protein
MPITKYFPACAKNVPGNSNVIMLAPIGDITSITETTGQVSAITMASGKKFVRIKANVDGVQYTSEGTFGTSGAETQNLIVEFAGRTTELENLKQEIIGELPCGLALIHRDNNSNWWLIGANAAGKDGVSRPINKLQVAFDSGKAITDEDSSKATFTFTRTSAYGAVQFDSTLSSALDAGTATFIDWT